MTHKQKEKKQNKNKIYKILIKINCVLIILLGLFYIISINDLSIKGFTLNKIKNNSMVLAKENEDMELKIMDLKSYDSINQRANGLRMVKVDKIDYINVISDGLAQK